MKLPFDRERMRERNLLDDIDEIRVALLRTPEERYWATLRLCSLNLELRRSNPEVPIQERDVALEEKARYWAPLRGLAKS